MRNDPLFIFFFSEHLSLLSRVHFYYSHHYVSKHVAGVRDLLFVSCSSPATFYLNLHPVVRLKKNLNPVDHQSLQCCQKFFTVTVAVLSKEV